MKSPSRLQLLWIGCVVCVLGFAALLVGAKSAFLVLAFAGGACVSVGKFRSSDEDR